MKLSKIIKVKKRNGKTYVLVQDYTNASLPKCWWEWIGKSDPVVEE